MRLVITLGFPGVASGKESDCQYRRHKRHRFDARVERSLGVGNGNLLQCSYLEISMGREAWWATVHEAEKSWTWLSNWAHTTPTLGLESSLKLCALQCCQGPLQFMGKPAKACLPLNQCIYEIFSASFGFFFFFFFLTQVQDFSFPNRDWTWAMAKKAPSLNC